MNQINSITDDVLSFDDFLKNHKKTCGQCPYWTPNIPKWVEGHKSNPCIIIWQAIYANRTHDKDSPWEEIPFSEAETPCSLDLLSENTGISICTNALGTCEICRLSVLDGRIIDTI